MSDVKTTEEQISPAPTPAPAAPSAPPIPPPVLKDQFVQPVGLNRIRTIRVETPRNVRSGPGKQYPDQGKQYEAEINTGDMIEIWMEPTEKDADGKKWRYIRAIDGKYAGKTGWICVTDFRPDLHVTGEIPKIDPVPVPETPKPAPIPVPSMPILPERRMYKVIIPVEIPMMLTDAEASLYRDQFEIVEIVGGIVK